ncbi:MAG: diguanylate cyclase domain-containing protein [Geodermatophilaceae bacterium]
MSDNLTEVIRLMLLAQTGDREQALGLADEQLLAAESPGMLYARAIALHSTGNHEDAARTAERILALTAGTGATLAPIAQAELAGWRSIALAFRAWQNIRLGETNPQAADLDSILHDLAQAEAMLANEVTEGFVLASAHNCLGAGYHELRLYELAGPHFEAAFAAATATTDVIVDRAAASLVNLAVMHLNWTLELLRIGDGAGASENCVIAAGHAAMALEYAATDDAKPYAAHAGVLLACADTNGGDDQAVVMRIRDALKALEGQGNRESHAFALPFLARALDRAGQHSDALNAAEQAISALPEYATWLTASAAYHTQATLLAQSGSDSARAALAYGNQLTETLWHQRLRTLHHARSLQVLERVTHERDRVRVLANTDALTGVGNRRAFDDRMAELGTSATDTAVVAMIAVDVDRLKAVNDAHGHEAGDRILQVVAGALTGQVRSGDLVARLGGDEFVAVLEGMDRSAAGEVAQRMVNAVSAALGSTLTVSVGVATGLTSEAGSSLLRAADRAMYAAKQNRRVVPTGSQPAVEDHSRTG